MAEKKEKVQPTFAPGFEPDADVTQGELDDPTAIAAAPVVQQSAPLPQVADLTTLVTALTALIGQMQGAIGVQQTQAVLAEMGSKVLSVDPIDVPAWVLANVKGFTQEKHYRVVDEVRYPQMGNRDPLVRTRGLPAEKLRELGIAIPDAK